MSALRDSPGFCARRNSTQLRGSLASHSRHERGFFVSPFLRDDRCPSQLRAEMRGIRTGEEVWGSRRRNSVIQGSQGFFGCLRVASELLHLYSSGAKLWITTWAHFHDVWG